MWTKLFWTAVAERAVKTAAQSAVALLSVDGMGLLDVDWSALASAVALATLLSVLTSVASSRAAGADGPSLATERLAPVPRGDAGAGEVRAVLLTAAGVVLGLAVWFWLIPAITTRL